VGSGDNPQPTTPKPYEEATMKDRPTAETFLDGFETILADAATTGRRLTRAEIESRRALGPLEQARGGAQPLLDTLTVYFDTGCVAAAAARRLSLSVRALTYRPARIHTLTGNDPADPTHRYTLQTAVIGARLLHWPTRPL
jgi:DNA-binding PucR family transcriptional regulator